MGFGQGLGHDFGGRRHQRRVERGADRQHDRPPGALRRGQRDRALDGLAMPADDDLSRAVVVRDGADLAVGRRLGDLARGLDVEAEQRRHRPDADRHRLLHRLAAALDEPGGIADRQRARRRQRRILAERMTGDIGGVTPDVEAAVAFEHADDREARRQQRRLRVLGQHQLAFRTLEHQPRQMLRQRVVDFVEQIARRREGLGERLAHAGRLRSLSGKDESPFHVRRIPVSRRGDPS